MGYIYKLCDWKSDMEVFGKKHFLEAEVNRVDKYDTYVDMGILFRDEMDSSSELAVAEVKPYRFVKAVDGGVRHCQPGEQFNGISVNGAKPGDPVYFFIAGDAVVELEDSEDYAIGTMFKLASDGKAAVTSDAKQAIVALTQRKSYANYKPLIQIIPHASEGPVPSDIPYDIFRSAIKPGDKKIQIGKDLVPARAIIEKVNIIVSKGFGKDSSFNLPNIQTGSFVNLEKAGLYSTTLSHQMLKEAPLEAECVLNGTGAAIVEVYVRNKESRGQ